MSEDRLLEGDCMNVAVAVAYGIPRSEHPPQLSIAEAKDRSDLDLQLLDWYRGWDEFAAERGYAWWRTDELAPVGLRRWIACVESPEPGENLGDTDYSEFTTHAVAMAGDQLLCDPLWLSPFEGPSYRRVTPTAIRASWALVKVGETIDVDCEPLPRPHRGGLPIPMNGSRPASERNYI